MCFSFSPDPQTNIRAIILRDGTDSKENIEIRRVFVHPSFEFPSLYNDIAVAELGKYFSIFFMTLLEKTFSGKFNIYLFIDA